MYQSSVSTVFTTSEPKANQGFYSNMHINSLIEDKKIIRIVKPKLQIEIEERAKNGRFQSHIIHHRGQLFLSLQKIADDSKREKVFATLRSYQVDKNVNIDTLPRFIRAILGESTHETTTNFISSLTISTFLGGVSGILALALCVIGLMVAGVPTVSEAGMKITATAFAAGSLLGCLFCTAVLWLRANPSALKPEK